MCQRPKLVNRVLRKHILVININYSEIDQKRDIIYNEYFMRGPYSVAKMQICLRLM